MNIMDFLKIILGVMTVCLVFKILTRGYKNFVFFQLFSDINDNSMTLIFSFIFTVIIYLTYLFLDFLF